MQRVLKRLRASSLVSLVAFTSAALVVATGAWADEEEEGHNDVLVFQDGGKVQIGGIDVDCFSGVGEPGCDPNGTTEMAFESELEATMGTPIVGVADEPGFFAIPDGGQAALPFGTILPSNAEHSVDFVLAPNSPVAGASILFWDGTGAVSWSAVPNGEYFDIIGNGGSGGILDGTSVLTSVELDPTSGIGFFDTHPDYLLNGDGGTDDPTIGFYAIFGQTNIEGLESSDVWGNVFDFGVEDEEAHEAAVESIAALVPEPTTALLVGLGLIGLGARRRGAVNA